jgi:hypothetical protein
VKSQAEFLKDIVSSLEQVGIPYMVSGSIGSTFYGRPRSTQDVDIVIEASSDNLRSLKEALSHTTLFNVFDASSGYKADFIIRKDRPYSVEEFRRRKPVDLLGLPVYLVAPEDAILSKVSLFQAGPSSDPPQPQLHQTVPAEGDEPLPVLLHRGVIPPDFQQEPGESASVEIVRRFRQMNDLPPETLPPPDQGKYAGGRT